MINIICKKALGANHILVMVFYQEQLSLVTFWFGGISKGFCGVIPAQLETTLIYIIHRSIHDTRTAQGTYDACWWGSPHIHLQSFVHRQYTHVDNSQIPEDIHVYRKSLTTSHSNNITDRLNGRKQTGAQDYLTSRVIGSWADTWYTYILAPGASWGTSRPFRPKCWPEH